MKRHRMDLISLGFGLFFVIVAAWWAVSYFLNLRLAFDVPNFGWILAGALIIVGVLGVLASLRRDRSEEPVDVPDAIDPAPDTADPTRDATDPALDDEPTQAR